MNENLRTTATIPIEFPEGYYVVCTLSTQTARKVKVYVVDKEGHDLITPLERENTKALPPVCAGFYMRGTQCRVNIEIPDCIIHPLIEHLDPATTESSLKICSYIIVADVDGRSDYRGVYLTVVAYQRRY